MAQKEDTNRVSFSFEVNECSHNYYVMFGTYVTKPSNIDFSFDGIQFQNIKPNDDQNKFRYHLMIPFQEINEFFYCFDSYSLEIYIKPIELSFIKIEECLHLGNESENEYKFDINSESNHNF